MVYENSVKKKLFAFSYSTAASRRLWRFPSSIIGSECFVDIVIHCSIKVVQNFGIFSVYNETV